MRRALARLKKVRLSIRLVVASTLLTAAVVCAVFLALSMSIRERTTRFFAQELSRNQQTLLKVQSHSLEQLLLTSSLITESPTLRAAIETYREESAAGGESRGQLLATIRDEALKIVTNLRKDLLVVTDTRGQVLASSGTRARPAVGADLSLLATVRKALDPLTPVDEPNFAVVSFGGQHFQVGCVPIVLRGFVIGTVILGETVDDAFAQELRQAFDGEIVVAAERAVMASTLRPEWMVPFIAALADPSAVSSAGARTVRLGGDEFVVAPLNLGINEAGQPVVLYLLRSLPHEMAQLNAALLRNFLLYGILTVVLMGVIAGVVSSMLTRSNHTLREQMAERERAETALRVSEGRLRQSQKLDSIGTLAGGIAHDFNNLLTVILSYTEMAMAEIPNPSQTHSDLGQVKKAAKRAADLTGQILAFSRKQILELQPLDLHGVVTGVDQMLRRLIGEHIELHTARRSTVPCVMADPGQLEQVIVNLAVNARDAMPKGGVLTIETAQVDMDEEDVRLLAPMAPGSWVKLSVRDSGMGMDEATRSRVFEPFFTTKARGEGTGLGMSTVYGIVKQSGGFIWISSTLGHGATIDIYFPPTKDIARPVEEVVEVSGAPTGSETILLVEDEDAVRLLVARTLRKSGYVVIEASNGREALQVAERHDGLLDLILTDVVMPRMSGPELVERLAPAHPATRVLYMSGYTADAFVGHGGLHPGTLLLQKPFSTTALAHKVRAVLNEPREAHEYAYATSN